MKAIFTYVKGAWKFYALVSSSALLDTQLSHLLVNKQEYQVKDVLGNDPTKIEEIEDALNA